MSAILEKIPYLEVYANPTCFFYLLLTLIPIVIGIFKRRRFPVYETVVSLIFIGMMFGGNHFHQLIAFLLYLIWQTICVFAYKNYRKSDNKSAVFYGTILLSLLPLILVKVIPLTSYTPVESLFAFMGISYLTFKNIGIIIELRDGTLTEIDIKSFLRFIIFLPTFSSGPIDRYRRFNEDYLNLPNQNEYLEMIQKAVTYIMRGFLYKFIISYILGTLLLPHLQTKALAVGGFFNFPTVLVMYVYGLNLFFDFAGYSLFAIGISYLMGIMTPENFHLPFLAPSLKEFWNRWHMSLSFWFRDFVFMRLVHTLIKNKTFKNRNMTSGFAYLVNMTIMGFWHGITWYYVAYGVFHGVGLIINDAWIRRKKSINRGRKKQGLKPLFESRFYHYTSIFITFHVVMFSLLLFSGFLNQLWFH